ncbi:MAG: glutamate--tRNA ligase [Parcubacteria group bacterium]|nr:glutamate--tRNA ligase [Parcubacteria group bacterium]
MKKKQIRVRFAPSPTGFLHIGGLRTALYNYLFTQKHKGKFVLRIEDTDQARSIKGGVEAIIQTLNNAGLDYDEGPILKGKKILEQGKYGPYIQSKRLKTYKKYADELVEKDEAYYCFCSADRLKRMREQQMKKKQPTMYDGKCKNLRDEEIQKRLKDKKAYVIRLNIPEKGRTDFVDIIRGHVSFDNSLIDDQVLMKSDGFPTYHLANVVDDHLMKITHVIRGEEWLSSTPKHILLYKALGWDAPAFAHQPLLLNPDKSKLSKRQGDVAVEDYLKKGYLPEAIFNFIALLGWNPTSNREVFELSELIREFELGDINKAGAVFNVEKLDWLNGHYLRKKSLKDFTELCIPYLKSSGLIKGRLNRNWLQKVLGLEQNRIKVLSEISYLTEFFFQTSLRYDAKMLVWKTSNPEETKKRLKKLLDFFTKLPEKDFTEKKLEKKIKVIIEEENLGMGDTLWPLRVALTGREKSPGPFEVSAVLGKKKVAERIKSAIRKLK